MKKLFSNIFLLLLLVVSLFQTPNVVSAQVDDCQEVPAPSPVTFERRIGWLTQLMATFQWQETSPGTWQLFLDINPIGGQETWVSEYPRNWAFRRPETLPQTIVEVNCPDPQEEVPLDIKPMCSDRGQLLFSIYNPNSFTVNYNWGADAIQYPNYMATPMSNTTVSFSTANNPGNLHVQYAFGDDSRTDIIEPNREPCYPSTTPTPSTPPASTPPATNQPTPSPEPQTNELKLSYSCSDKRWNAEVKLTKNNTASSNVRVTYQAYGKEEVRNTDNSGINNYPFNDEGKGLLKVYIDSFNGHEVELKAPACTPEGTDPQSARGRVLGASTMFADTGSAELIKAQVAFVASIIAGAVAMKLARTAKHA